MTANMKTVLCLLCALLPGCTAQRIPLRHACSAAQKVFFNIGNALMKGAVASMATVTGLILLASRACNCRHSVARNHGCAGVAQIAGLQEKLHVIGQGGYRHHVSMTPGYVERAVREAFTKYLKYEIQAW